MSKDDLVSRLRAWAEVVDIPSGKFVNEDIAFAATRITALEAEVDAKNSLIAEMKDKHGATIRRAEALSSKLKLAEAALEPFAAKSKAFDDAADQMGFARSDDTYRPRTEFTYAELRHARSALHSIRED